MFEDIDFTKAIVDFTTYNVDKFYSAGKELIKGASDTARLRMKSSYTDYLMSVWKRYSGVRSFFNRNESLDFYRLYVPISLRTANAYLRDPTAQRIAERNPKAIFSGSGGSGKTILMRHLLLSTILTKEKVPLFIELRDFNHETQDILGYLKSVLHANHFSLNDEYVDKALESGHFLILLDGFDEVPLTARREIANQIISLARDYTQNWIFISSRPDPMFSNWLDFAIFEMAPLTKEQAGSVIQKLPFDEEVKADFLIELRENLYNSHKSFLSNPLLLSIMLLTYSQNAEIPNKLSVFYSNAYDALFQRHDAMKGGFRRQRYSSLDSQDFANVFAAFSLVSYDSRAIQMTRSMALDFLDKAKKVTGIQFDSEAYLADSIQSICLLVEEGLWVSFAHRSFQEYFVARFIEDAKPEIQSELISRYSTRFPQDSVLVLLHEMNSAMLNRLFLLPKLADVAAILNCEVKNKIARKDYLRFLKAIGTGAKIQDTGEYEIDFYDSSLTKALLLLRHIYGNVYKGEWRIDAVDWAVKVSRYAPDKRYLKITFEELEPSDGLLADLWDGLGPFSVHGVEWFLKLRVVLLNSQTVIDRSLSEVLGIR